MFVHVVHFLSDFIVLIFFCLDVTGGKAPLTIIKKLSNKARQFNKCVKKAKGHLQRLGDENDRERYVYQSNC